MTRTKRIKSSDKRPCRPRYWGSRRLEKRKVHRLFATGRFPSKIDALNFWHNHRKGRVKFDLYLKDRKSQPKETSNEQS